ncbi:hypothetical protein VTL71DRAFT_10526 [Oculimacula yallundae]|uniref:Uncharacterized protein n=1 Tax=Oculimacula yallundae TaxID=86028 RepID=A0ABR4CUE8_9HELO
MSGPVRRPVDLSTHKADGTIVTGESVQLQLKHACTNGTGLSLETAEILVLFRFTMVHPSISIVEGILGYKHHEDLRKLTDYITNTARTRGHQESPVHFTPNEVRIWCQNLNRAHGCGKSQSDNDGQEAHARLDGVPHEPNSRTEAAVGEHKHLESQNLSNLVESSSIVAAQNDNESVASTCSPPPPSPQDLSNSPELKSATQALTLPDPESLVSLNNTILETTGFSSLDQLRRSSSNLIPPQIRRDIEPTFPFMAKELVEEDLAKSTIEDPLERRPFLDGQTEPNREEDEVSEYPSVEFNYSRDTEEVIRERIYLLFLECYPELNSDERYSLLPNGIVEIFRARSDQFIQQGIEQEGLTANHIMTTMLNNRAEVIQVLSEKLDEMTEKNTMLAQGVKEIELTLDKKLSDAKSQAAEDLRAERGAYTKMKQTLGQKIADLEEQLQARKTDFDKAQTANTKRQTQFDSMIQKAKTKVIALNQNLDEKAAEWGVLQRDYDATLTELNELREEKRKSSDSRDKKLLNLEQELAVLRSFRPNPEFEKDNVTRAVGEATQGLKVELEKKQRQLHDKQAELNSAHEELSETQNELNLAHRALNEKSAELKEAWELVTDRVEEKDDLIKSFCCTKNPDGKNCDTCLDKEMLEYWVSTRPEVRQLERALKIERAKSDGLEGDLSRVTSLLKAIGSLVSNEIALPATD